MKLVRIRKSVGATHHRSDAVPFYDWFDKKERESRALSSAIARIEMSYDYDAPGRHYGPKFLRLIIATTGSRWSRDEVKGNNIEKMISFLDKAKAECKSKFPDVEVDW